MITVYSGWQSKGGTAVSTFLIAKDLKRLGHNVFISSIDEYPDFKNFVFFDIRKIPIFFIRDWCLKTFFKKIIKEQKIDLVYASDCRFTAVGAILAAKEMNIKSAVHYRDYWFCCLRGDMLHGAETCDGQGFDFCFKHQPGRRFIWEYYKKKYFQKRLNILAQADFSLAVSQAMLARVKAAGISENIYNVYDLFELPENIAPKNNKSDNDSIKILFIGRLVEHRGVKTLLEVAQKSLISRPNFKFVIVGDGEMMEYCLKIKRDGKLENIEMVGAVPYDKVEKYYKECDVFFFPALLEEPLGRVVIEAMSYGLPVVASNRGGIKEVINNNGFLVDPFNIDACLEKITACLENINVYSKNSINISRNFSKSKIGDIIKDTIINP
ncbi:MAG: glycosyltransferase family 4 protein [Patescibacteria group bacterium]|nr:glycosyltransferase family 4 protein [Patescibacteria group bacterium]